LEGLEESSDLVKPSPRVGYLLCVLAAVVWSGTAPGISYLVGQGTPPLALAFWRDAIIAVACGAGIALAALAAGRPLPRLSAGELRGFAAIGVVSVGVYHALFVTSIALNGAALGIVLIYLYPAFVTLGAWLLFKEPIGPAQVAALALALVGCGLLVRIYDPAVLRVSWVGILVGVLSAVTHAGYVLFNQRAVTNHSPWLSLALTMSFGALALLALTLLGEGPAALTRVGDGGLSAWLALLALALGPTLMGYAMFTISLRHIPGRVASLIVVIEAPITTLAAVLLLGERLEPPQVVGMALILAAAVLPGLQLGRRQGAPAAAGD
jgi:drug/metabolite transporter (DMT)-like permease